MVLVRASAWATKKAAANRASATGTAAIAVQFGALRGSLSRPCSTPESYPVKVV
jgi:hypothetical protein